MAVSLRRNLFLALLLSFITAAYATSRCAHPRVRREWRSISEADRKEWIDAFKCLRKVPHKPALTPIMDRNVSLIPPVNPNSSYHDDFVYIHMDLNPLIHFTGLFLPWHRAYINDFENAMRTECNYTGVHPYWNWTLDATPDFPNSPMFSDSPTTGFGGWGDPADDLQISTGAFVEDFELVYPVPHRLRRNYTERGSNTNPFGDGTFAPITPLWTLFSPGNVSDLINGHVGDFEGFQAKFEGTTGPHGAVHGIISADMLGACPRGLGPPDCVRGPKWTPNDPFFMMHHAMVDKVWYDWQNAHPENFWSFFGGTVTAHSQPGMYAQFPTGGPPFLNFGDEIPTDGILRNATIYDVMDTQNEMLCYKYE